MKKIYRFVFENGEESVSTNKNTVISIDKQKPIDVLEDNVNEEYFDLIGIDAVAMRDEERKVEKEKKEKELQEKKEKTKL